MVNRSQNRECGQRDVPVGVPLDLSTPTEKTFIGTYGENASQTMFQNIVLYNLFFYYYDMKN